nr:MAG TPA: hypothetical protein [Caudoviricetes sp.]
METYCLGRSEPAKCGYAWGDVVVIFPFAFNPDKITLIRVITCYYIRKNTVYIRFINTRTNSYGCYSSRMFRNIILIVGITILDRVSMWS